MNPLTTLLAALSGYLLGSISFARVVTRLFKPEQDISRIRVTLPDGQAAMESDSVSATTVRMYLGPRFGMLTMALDMLKAAAPALVFRLWQPGAPYDLVAAGMATVGHNWPLYYRFKGGRGLSPILGGMLVLDWLGVLVTNVAGFLLGLPIKNMLVVTGAGIILMIPWVALRGNGTPALLYVVLMNMIFWGAMTPELREYARLRRAGQLEAFVDAQRLRVEGRGGGELVEQISLSKLRARILRLFGGDRSE